MRIESGPPGFTGRVLLVGCGSVGQTVLPLLLRQFALDPANLTVLTADGRGHEVATAHGIRFEVAPLTRDRFAPVLEGRLRPGDFLLNLSVDVSSLELLRFASSRGALYLDTGIEPWPGGYTDPDLSLAERSNQAFRARTVRVCCDRRET